MSPRSSASAATATRPSRQRADAPRALADGQGAAARACTCRPPSGTRPSTSLAFYERCAGLGEPSHLRFFPFPPPDLRELALVAGRDLDRRRQHREHARDLAGARLRRDPARGVGGRRRPLRRERRDDLLVRGRRDRLVRARSSRACPTGSASSPAARARTTTARSCAGRATASSSTAASRKGSRPTTASGSTSSAPSCARSSPAGPGAAAYRVTRDGEERLERATLPTVHARSTCSSTGHAYWIAVDGSSWSTDAVLLGLLFGSPWLVASRVLLWRSGIRRRRDPCLAGRADPQPLALVAPVCKERHVTGAFASPSRTLFAVERGSIVFEEQLVQDEELWHDDDAVDARRLVLRPDRPLPVPGGGLHLRRQVHDGRAPDPLLAGERRPEPAAPRGARARRRPQPAHRRLPVRVRAERLVLRLDRRRPARARDQGRSSDGDRSGGRAGEGHPLRALHGAPRARCSRTTTGSSRRTPTSRAT